MVPAKSRTSLHTEIHTCCCRSRSIHVEPGSHSGCGFVFFWCVEGVSHWKWPSDGDCTQRKREAQIGLKALVYLHSALSAGVDGALEYSTGILLCNTAARAY